MIPIINVLRVGDDRFKVHRTSWGEGKKEYVSIWESISPSFKVFRNENLVFYCELIEEVKIISDDTSLATL